VEDIDQLRQMHPARLGDAGSLVASEICKKIRTRDDGAIFTHSSDAAMRHYHPACDVHLSLHRSWASRPANRWRILMKTMVLAAVASLSLGVGVAYAQGVPAGYQEPHYGAAAFSDHQNEAQTQFLGPNTVLGKMLKYNLNSDRVVATATSTKGG
jgi:hypothetical protein